MLKTETEKSLETFKSRDGVQYSAYRDKEGKLRVAQIMDRASGNSKYAEELDTYTVVNKDIEQIKTNSKEGYEKSLVQQKTAQLSVAPKHKEDDSLAK